MGAVTYLLLVGSLGGASPLIASDAHLFEEITPAAITLFLSPADAFLGTESANAGTGAFRRLSLKACPGSNPSITACPA